MCCMFRDSFSSSNASKRSIPFGKPIMTTVLPTANELSSLSSGITGISVGKSLMSRKTTARSSRLPASLNFSGIGCL